jgi:cytochrome b
MLQKVKVWDWPLRLFHWGLVLVVTAAVVTGKMGGPLADWHGRLGIVVLGLVVFRLLWGFVGTTHSRFADFFPTPARLLAYGRGVWQGLGHNPLGGLSVLALLGLLLLQVVSGLFANDDIAFEGPWAVLVDKSLSDRLTAWHGRLSWGLLGLIGLHIAAVGFYARFKKINLLLPMMTGYKRIAADDGIPISSGRLEPGWLLVSTVMAAGLALSVANGVLPDRFIRLLDITAPAVDIEEPEPAVL